MVFSLRHGGLTLLAGLGALATGCEPDRLQSRPTPEGDTVTTPPSSSQTTETPPAPPPPPVLMQAFYWNVPQLTPEGSYWNHLAAIAPGLAKVGITAVWIPPPSKGHVGKDDMGYGIYDPYDLGELEQKGSVATRFGTRAELLAMIDVLHGEGLAVYADMVLNHRMGGDTKQTVQLLDGTSAQVSTGFTFPGRKGQYSGFVWDSSRFNGCEEGGTWKQWHAWDFEPTAEGGYDNLLGCEVRYSDPEVRAEAIAWGQWMNETLGLDGYRLDATKHMWTPFFTEWLDAVKGPRFAVSEAFWGDVEDLSSYAETLGGRTHFFDVPLHYVFQSMSEANGAFDLRELAGAGFVARNGALAVTFVDNHDTDSSEGVLSSPVKSFKGAAYAYILLRAEGIPTVFYRDYFDYGHGAEIDELIEIRRRQGLGPGAENDATDEDVYVYERLGEGDEGGLVLMLSDAGGTTKEVTTHFASATLVDVTGHVEGAVTTDEMGTGTFPVPGGSYAVWMAGSP